LHCFIAAQLIGIGGIQQPQRVALYIFTDVKDEKVQLERIVCTWPDSKIRVCRDWNTGKLIEFNTQ
jgi:hypothetical protein